MVDNVTLTTPVPIRGATRYALALGIVIVATLLRFAADPLLRNQVPYFFYLPAVVIATWLCGPGAAVLATLLSGLAGNYFFSTPRDAFSLDYDDAFAVGTFVALSFVLIWTVGRWRRAEAELRRASVDLWRSREVLQAATLAAEVGVWTWVPGTGETTVGANWRDLFGVAPEHPVTFDTWTNALHSDDRQNAIDTLNAAWRDRSVFSIEYRVVRPDGSVRWVTDRGKPFHDAAGAVIGMAGVNVDITKRRAAEQAAWDANRMKDDFLATLSHELRTPLNAIMGWSDMLRQRRLQGPHQERAAESIHRNAQSLNEMINDVLDVSRIVSGKLRVDLQRTDPADALQHAIESVRAAADAKNVTIMAELGDVPMPLIFDPTRLQQVFWNLLSNAVKFTPAGGHVRVLLGYTGGQVQVRVADTGMGITPDFLPHVFERFRQRDSSITRTHGGLGLGLAIVRHLVELHGGTVKAESAGEGQGAVFTVELPVQPEERRRGQQAVVRPVIQPLIGGSRSLHGVRALVVDDDRDAREVVASVLEDQGATVAAAANAEQALDQVTVFAPSVLLIDIGMPGTDGYTLIQRIRNSGCSTPAIALTAYAREEDQQRALSVGFDLHLAKPTNTETLVRAVTTVRRATT